MLTVHQLSKSYSTRSLFHKVSFSINAGERIGLIGANGCGKTTLLRILVGQEKPDHGNITITRPNLRMGYLPQGLELPAEWRLDQAIAHAAGLAGSTEDEIERLAVALAGDPSNRHLQAAYDAALQSMQTSPGKLQLETILKRFGLESIPPDQPVGTLSGGQKTRLGLALVLLTNPHLLLLDEPTNHLDLLMLAWLEAWLEAFRGAALIVSHDRTFLDHCVTSILEMDAGSGQLHAYAGNYTAYLSHKQAEMDQQWAAYQDQQAEIQRMRQDIARTKAQAAHTERAASSIRIGGPDYKVKGYKTYQQAIAKKVAAKALARQKKLARYLEAPERVDKPTAGWQVKLEFAPPEQRSRDVLVMQDLAVGYPGGEPVLHGLNQSVRGGDRLALTGPNGSGKTTLLRTIAGQLPPLSGRFRLGQSIHAGWLSQEQEWLDLTSSPLQQLQRVAVMNETDGRSFLHYYLFSGDDALRPAESLSYGERARLSLALLVAQGCNFLLLDEPLNHLDIPSRERFEQALARFPGAVLAAIHDRTFIERFATQTWQIEEQTIRIL